MIALRRSAHQGYGIAGFCGVIPIGQEAFKFDEPLANGIRLHVQFVREFS
jgi:hypothetical protein